MGVFFLMVCYNQDMQSEKVKKANAATRVRLAKEAKVKTEQKRHDEIVAALSLNRQMQLQTMQALTLFLKGNTTSAKITNWIDRIGTPDVLKLKPGLRKIEEAVKNKDIDWAPVLDLLEKMESHLSQVPKDHPEVPEQPEVDLSETNNILTELKIAIDNLELHADAPKITVQKPDLTGVEAALTRFVEVFEKSSESEEPIFDGPKPVTTDDGDLKVFQTNLMVDKKYDDFRIEYDSWDDEDPRMKAVNYFYMGELVATINFSYNEKGLLMGGRLDATTN